MRIYTSDNKRTVDIGTGSLWLSVYSTAAIRLSDDDKDFLQFAMDFLKSGECIADDAQITARQMELLRRRFAKIAPADAVYDLNDPQQKAPWGHFSSKSVTSCANLYTTADGKDLFDEVIDLLKYADANRIDTLVE